MLYDPTAPHNDREPTPPAQRKPIDSDAKHGQPVVVGDDAGYEAIGAWHPYDAYWMDITHPGELKEIPYLVTWYRTMNAAELHDFDKAQGSRKVLPFEKPR